MGLLCTSVSPHFHLPFPSGFLCHSTFPLLSRLIHFPPFCIGFPPFSSQFNFYLQIACNFLKCFCHGLPLNLSSNLRIIQKQTHSLRFPTYTLFLALWNPFFSPPWSRPSSCSLLINFALGMFFEIGVCSICRYSLSRMLAVLPIHQCTRSTLRLSSFYFF